MDQHELAWAAGFFDGDGWAALVRFGRRGKRRPMAQINQGSSTGVPEVLVRFRDTVGVGRIAGPKIEVGSSRGDVLKVGELIGPWLSAQKRVQFSETVGLTFRRVPISSKAWAAGLFDAEGSTSLNAHRSHPGYKYVEAAITQGGRGAIPQELVRFSDVVALGKVYGPYEQEGASEPIYRWRLQQVDGVRRMLHLVQPWLGNVKRVQAWTALAVIDGQPELARGRADWGSHKTRCIHGHEYATARLRPYLSRGGTERRASKQCLACTREQARARRAARK